MSTSRATGLLAEEPEDDDHRQKITAELKARGNEAFKSNSMREALALYTRAVELTPSDRAWAGHLSALHGNISMVRLQLGDFAAALSDAEEAIRLDSNWAKGYMRQAQALEKLERYAEASIAMEEAIRRTANKKAKGPMQKVLLKYKRKAAAESDEPSAAAVAEFFERETKSSAEARGTGPTSPSADGATAGSAGAVLTELLAKTICVTGLPDQDTVIAFCKGFGPVLGVSMFQNSKRRSKSWAFVTLANAEDAEKAVLMGLRALVPGKQIVVSLQSSNGSTWDALVQIENAADVGVRKSRELGKHTASVSALGSGPTLSSSEEEEEEEEDGHHGHGHGHGEEEQRAKRAKLQAERELQALISKHTGKSGDTEEFDLLIVGAGASGVGCGVMARAFGVDPRKTLIVERGSAVGSTFEKWPAEMRFITPSFNQQAFGMMDLNSVCFDTSPAQMFHVEHPTGQQYAEYLRVVAHMHKLPVATETDVTAVKPISQRHGGVLFDDDGFEVSLTQSSGATRKLPAKIRAKYVIWAAGEFQYPNADGFPGASEHCVHNSSIRSWAELAKENDERVIIGGYESGIDATVHLAAAGCNVTVLASTPFWSKRTLDPSTELAPFTADRLKAAMDGSNPPTFMSHCRVTRVEKDQQGGGYVVTAVKTTDASAAEELSLQLERPPTGFGLNLETSTSVTVSNIKPGGPAEQAGLKVGDIVVEIAGVQVEGREAYGLVEAMERVESLAAEMPGMKFEFKVKRPPPEAPVDADGASEAETVHVKTRAKPVLAVGFSSGVGQTVNHLFDWTEESLCASGSDSAGGSGSADEDGASIEKLLQDGASADKLLEAAVRADGGRKLLEAAAEADKAGGGGYSPDDDLMARLEALKAQVSKPPAQEPSDTAPIGDAKLTKCDESTICPGLFLCGPQVRQDDEIFCFVYKYRQRFAVVVNEIAKRLGVQDAPRKKVVAFCKKRHMFLDDISCCKATCGAGSC